MNVLAAISACLHVQFPVAFQWSVLIQEQSIRTGQPIPTIRCVLIKINFPANNCLIDVINHKGSTVVNADQYFTADFLCEDDIINIDRAFYALYYGAIEKRSIATSPFAVNR